MTELPEQLRQEMSQQPDGVVYLIDPISGERFVLLRAAVYDEAKSFTMSETASDAELTPSRFSFDPIQKIREEFGVLGSIRMIPDAPDFALTDQGDIFRVHQNGKIVKRHFSPSKDGYVHYRIDRPDGTSKGGTLNNLVLQVFRPRGRHQGDQARHKDDRNKLNNSLSNLFWGTHSENMEDRDRHGANPMLGSRNPTAKLTDDQVREIRILIEQGARIKEIASRFKVSYNAVRQIKNGNAWKHIV